VNPSVFDTKGSMHTGLSSQSDTLTATLRRFAYNRTSGTVEFGAGGRRFSIVVVHGKMAAVEDSGWNVVDDVLRRLRRAGRLPPALAIETSTIDRLFSELEGRLPAAVQPIDEVFFRRVVRETVLDKLLSLPLAVAVSLGSGALRGDISPRFSPAIDTEDLRYDVESIADLTHRFRRAFPVGARIVGGRCTLHRFSPIEQTILGLMVEPVEVDALYNRALFSRVRFYEGLLSLLDRGLLQVIEPPTVDGSAPVTTALTSLIDASVEVEVIGRELSQAAIADKAETEILQTELSPRGIVSLFRRLTGG